MNALERKIADRPSNAEIRAVLDHVVASPAFSRSPQLANFLRFVVEQTLAGHSDRIKAYTIAADALGRDSNFDPQNDPIVRVEAVRLRQALKHYYANDGYNDPVVIELPRGHYVPVFRANSMPLRAVVRIRQMRRTLTDIIKGNFRLLILIVVIASLISLSLDFMFMTWTTAKWDELIAAIQAANPDLTGGLKR